MKHRLISLFAVTSFVLGPLAPAHGQSSGQSELSLRGESVPSCTMSPGAQSQASNASFSNGKLTIENLTDPATAMVKTASVEIIYEAMCNYKTSVSVASANAGLVPTSPVEDPDGSFLHKVPYTITGSWGSLPLPTYNTAVLPANTVISKDTVGARNGTLVLRVSTEASATPLVAGTFTDIILVKIGPTP